VTTGIYAHIRHPMYTAVIVMFLGYLLFFGSLVNIPLWIGILVLYAVKAVKEEGVLAERFPEYEEYKSRTWRFFPPF
jgi:protein-S-isoprenylcysteine O-methyltransferase Ste14